MKTRYKMFAFFICMFPIFSSAQPDTTIQGGNIDSLQWGGLKRTYIVHLPTAYDATKTYPLVLVFHGGGSNARQWMPFCGMNETADKNNFIVVYPNGTGKSIEGYDIFGWNGGPHIPGGTESSVSKVDDVGFTKVLIDTLEKQFHINPKQVYAAGMSMGAMMVFRLASELSDRIAAIAPISGPMATDNCHPVRPVSIIYFHGTEDPAVPYFGGKGKIDPSGNVYFSVDYTLQHWLKANGCMQDSTTIQLPDTTHDSTTIVRKTYDHCTQNATIILYTIGGGGHTWPGRDFGPELKVLGRSTKNIYANDLIWDFFRNHPME